MSPTAGVDSSAASALPRPRTQVAKKVEVVGGGGGGAAAPCLGRDVLWGARSCACTRRMCGSRKASVAIWARTPSRDGGQSRPTNVAFRKYWSHVSSVAKRGSVCRKHHTQQSVLFGSVHKRRVLACKDDNTPR